MSELEQAIRKTFNQFNDGKYDLFTLILRISLDLKGYGKGDETGLNGVGFFTIVDMAGQTHLQEIQFQLNRIFNSAEGDKEIGNNN